MNKTAKQQIRAGTTKVGSYDDFQDWISFGGETIKSVDPVEQAKQTKYSKLIADSIMLHNVSDLTGVLNEMASEGIVITKELFNCLRSYIENISGGLDDMMLIWPITPM
ncbi:hypothetical protein PULV_a3936 [Pseudoalteromonas ulvae UL12]|nr:hypothetical protein [Pseudoalteromonas ulvae UL12]